MGCSARIRGCRQAECGERIRVFLTLHDPDNGLTLEFLKSVGNATHATHVPDPSAAAVRPALAEVLRNLADRLKDQRPGFVAVVVRGDNSRRASVLLCE